MSRTFPIALELEGRPCLVVGSSAEAVDRVRALASSGARVQLVAKEPSAEHRRVAAEHAVTLCEREFDESDLDHKWLAVLTDRDAGLAQRMARAADARRVFFCATDQPEHNSFSHLALARAGLVTIAIGTEGQAPALARKLREELQRLIDSSGLAEVAEELAELRRNTPSERRREVLGQAVADIVIEGRIARHARP